MAIQCDCFCRDRPINKFYPQSCAECTIELCKKHNTRGYSGWCLFGQRAVHCSKHNSIPPIYVS